MTGPFTTPIIRVNDSLDPRQKARGAALLVAAEARPGSSPMDLLRLADYVVQGAVLSTERAARNPMELFGNRQMDLDPVHAFDGPNPPRRPRRLPNFGDLDGAGSPEELAEDDDGLG